MSDCDGTANLANYSLKDVVVDREANYRCLIALLPGAPLESQLLSGIGGGGGGGGGVVKYL